MSAVRRNGRRTIFCWCKSARAKAPAAQEKPVRTLSAQKNAGRFAPGNTAFLGRFVQMRRENGRILHKSAACFCTLCLVVTNVRGNTPYFPSHLPSSPARGTWIEIAAWSILSRNPTVVPRKGDVDRNHGVNPRTNTDSASSPARGTWIEMSRSDPPSATGWVVPRKGDVDRNGQVGVIGCHRVQSSPARGTWIEISAGALKFGRAAGRPPQGGRG